MTGLTREGPKIDRVACTWLISRLVDQAPEFRHGKRDPKALLTSVTG